MWFLFSYIRLYYYEYSFSYTAETAQLLADMNDFADIL